MASVKMDLAALEGLAKSKAEKGIRDAALTGEALLKADILSRPGTGRVYGNHRASSPGQPPAPDIGRLRNSVQADPNVRRDRGDLVGRVVANIEYAAALEKGTERVAARPFLSLLKSDYGPRLLRAFIAGAK